MSILVPFNNLAALNDFYDAGAREFYIGFVDEAWQQSFGAQADINRLSGFRSQANAYTFEELCALIPQVVDKGAQLYVPFNTGIYTAAQLTFIVEHYFEPLAQAGATGVILSGPELIARAKAAGLMAVASTMCGIYNADIAQFYEQAGIDRIIFPRETTLAEMEKIRARVPRVSFEVFLMRNGCIFSDSHCLGCHRSGHYSLCRDLRAGVHWNEQLFGFSPEVDAVLEANNAEWNSLFAEACGLCALWRLEQMGANAYKIVGRCDNAQEVAADIALVARNIEIARESATEADYLARMERPLHAARMCKTGRNCYYPECHCEA